MEIFRVHAELTVLRVRRPVVAVDFSTPMKNRVNDDVRKFGTSIARAHLEEEVGLEYARVELKNLLAVPKSSNSW